MPLFAAKSFDRAVSAEEEVEEDVVLAGFVVAVDVLLEVVVVFVLEVIVLPVLALALATSSLIMR